MSSVATVRLRVGSEQCCYRTVAGWPVDLNKDVAFSQFATYRAARKARLAGHPSYILTRVL